MPTSSRSVCSGSLSTSPRQGRAGALAALGALIGTVTLFVLTGTAAAVGPTSAPSHTGTTRGAALDCTQGSVNHDEAIAQLRVVRESIQRSLDLLDEGRRKEAFEEAKAGYLNCFEAVEAPLDVIAGVSFRFEVEDAFARVRGLIQSGASTSEVRDRIVTLRDKIDQTERRFTSAGVSAPLIVFGQSFTLLLREGLEAVLLLSVLLTYLESTKHGARYRKPILYGVGLAILATIATFFLVDAIFSVLPFGRELLEAAVGILAVVVLVYLSFWLTARLEQRRWLEFLKARVWTAVSAGSVASLALIGFTSVYREGFETVLFYQAMDSFTTGLELWMWLGILAAAVVLAGVAYAVLKLGRTLPVQKFLGVAVIVVMLTSVAVLGNAMRALQESAVIDLDILHGWPNLPIYLAQATGYYATLPSVIAQLALLGVYGAGAFWFFVLRPRRRLSPGATPIPPELDAPGLTLPVGTDA